MLVVLLGDGGLGGGDLMEASGGGGCDGVAGCKWCGGGEREGIVFV